MNKLTIRALAIIGKIANAATTNTAVQAVNLIKKVHAVTVDVAEERVTAEDALAELTRFEEGLAANDAAADAALKKKFGDS